MINQSYDSFLNFFRKLGLTTTDITFDGRMEDWL